tara:strand:+ start:348 stop:713 length:366 start_codon:yes stop_codon:yes gene_type:complete
MKTGKNLYYSISKKLQKDKKINDEFEIMINSLSLEEVIALKLELSTRSLRGKFYGFPIWKSLPELTRDAVLKYALSATRSKKEAARFLGITVSELNKNLKQYGTESFFKNGDGKEMLADKY